MSRLPQPRAASCGAACARKGRFDDFPSALRSARDRAPKDGRPIYVYRCTTAPLHFHLAHTRGPETIAVAKER